MSHKNVWTEIEKTLVHQVERLDFLFNGGATGANRRVGVILLTFPFGIVDATPDYVSNGVNRQHAAMLLRQIAAKLEGQPETRGRA